MARPGLLGDDHQADAHLGHDLHRLRRNGRGECATFEACQRSGPDLDARLLVELAVVLHDAGLQGAEHGGAVLLEPSTGLAHRDPEADELLLPETPPEPEDGPAAGQWSSTENFSATRTGSCHAGR